MVHLPRWRRLLQRARIAAHESHDRQRTLDDKENFDRLRIIWVRMGFAKAVTLGCLLSWSGVIAMPSSLLLVCVAAFFSSQAVARLRNYSSVSAVLLVQWIILFAVVAERRGVVESLLPITISFVASEASVLDRERGVHYLALLGAVFVCVSALMSLICSCDSRWFSVAAWVSFAQRFIRPEITKSLPCRIACGVCRVDFFRTFCHLTSDVIVQMRKHARSF